MNEAELYNVNYTSKNGESSSRTIIPTTVIANPSNIKAVDVSDLSDQERSELQGLINDYKEYKSLFISRMFTLDEWIEHTTGVKRDLKFRTFVKENLEVIK